METDSLQPSRKTRFKAVLWIWLGLCVAPALASGVIAASRGAPPLACAGYLFVTLAHLGFRAYSLFAFAVTFVWLTASILRGRHPRWFVWQAIALAVLEAANAVVGIAFVWIRCRPQ